jgi:hypothetical protein
MANTFTLQSKSYDGRYMKLTCSQTINIANNQSTISWKLETIGGNSNYYYTGPTTLTIAGTQCYYRKRTGAHEFPAAKGSTSGTITINHGTDGKKSIAVSLSTAIYTSTVSTKSGTWELDTIPRGASITAAPNFDDEANPTISYTNPAGNNVSNLYAYIYSADDKTVLIQGKSLTKTGTSYTFNFTDAERKVLRKYATKNTAEVHFVLRTILGSNEFWDNVSKTMTIKNPNPVLTFEVTDTNTHTAGLTGDSKKMIIGYSKATYLLAAVPQKESLLVKTYVANGDNEIETDWTDRTNDGSMGEGGQLGLVQSSLFTYEATDTRGNKTTQTYTAPTVNYFPLTCNQKATMELTGETEAQMKLNISGNFFNRSFGAKTNVLNVSYRIATGNGEFGNWVSVSTISKSGDSYSADVVISGLTYSNSYKVQSKVIDYLNTIESSVYTAKSVPVFDWSKDDFRFNVPISLPKSHILETYGEGGINLNNSDITGANAIYFSDAGNSIKEGIMFPRNDALASIQYDRFNVLNGNATIVKNCSMNGNSLEAGTAYLLLDTQTVADYVVEEGTTDSWIWRKWNSGKAECYRVKGFNTKFTQTWGTMYQSDSEIARLNYPITFTKIPIETVSVGGGVGYAGWIFCQNGGRNTTTQSGLYKLCRPTTVTAASDFYINYAVFGFWK